MDQTTEMFVLEVINLNPGITVRQIPQINGEAHLCEVFLDNVEVPADQLVGEPGMGWTYAKFLLEHERTTSSFIYWSKRELARAKEIAERLTRLNNERRSTEQAIFKRACILAEERGMTVVEAAPEDPVSQAFFALAREIVQEKAEG